MTNVDYIKGVIISGLKPKKNNILANIKNMNILLSLTEAIENCYKRIKSI